MYKVQEEKVTVALDLLKPCTANSSHKYSDLAERSTSNAVGPTNPVCEKGAVTPITKLSHNPAYNAVQQDWRIETSYETVY